MAYINDLFGKHKDELEQVSYVSHFYLVLFRIISIISSAVPEPHSRRATSIEK